MGAGTSQGRCGEGYPFIDARVQDRRKRRRRGDDAVVRDWASERRRRICLKKGNGVSGGQIVAEVMAEAGWESRRQQLRF